MLKIDIISAVSDNPEDTLTFNMPALIRCLEVAREQIKDDNSLHLFVEALHSRQGEDCLSTEDVIAAQEESGLSEEEEEDDSEEK